jgi:hypothetical protein
LTKRSFLSVCRWTCRWFHRRSVSRSHESTSHCVDRSIPLDSESSDCTWLARRPLT